MKAGVDFEVTLTDNSLSRIFVTMSCEYVMFLLIYILIILYKEALHIMLFLNVTKSK